MKPIGLLHNLELHRKCRCADLIGIVMSKVMKNEALLQK